MNNSDPTGYYIDLTREFTTVGVVASVLSCIEMITIVAFRNTPWGKLVSAAVSITSVASNLYSYAKSNKSAKKRYGKNSKTYKRILKHNNIILACNIALIIIAHYLSRALVRKYSVAIALALIKARTITILGICINIVELLSGKSIMYKSKKWW